MSDRSFQRIFAAAVRTLAPSLRPSAQTLPDPELARWRRLLTLSGGALDGADSDEFVWKALAAQGLFAALIRCLLNAAFVAAVRKKNRREERRRQIDHFLGRPLPIEIFTPERFDFFTPLFDSAERLAAALPVSQDPFGTLYQTLFPKPFRRRLGEFFTPAPLADYLIHRAETSFVSSQRSNSAKKKEDPRLQGAAVSLIDPSCGSGTFLLTAARRLRARGATWREICSRLTGLDLNPISVLMARANLAAAILSDPPDDLDDLEGPLPIFLFDALRGESPDEADKKFVPIREKYDLVVGNPPWLHWDRLPSDYRRETAELWRRYGLFNLAGAAARLGGGKKELAGLFLLAAADHFLSPGGRLAMVVPLSLLKSGRSGEGFRQLRPAPNNQPLALTELDDFSAASPFPDVQTPVAALLLANGKTSGKETGVRRWTPGIKKEFTFPDAESKRLAETLEKRHGEAVHFQPLKAAPSDSARPESALRFFDPLAEQISGGRKKLSAEAKKENHAVYYTARLGVNTAGANGVYWLHIDTERRRGEQGEKKTVFTENLADAGRRKIEAVRAELESALIFPLVRWRDVGEFFARPSCSILLPQNAERRRGLDAETMANRFPRALEYLQRFEEPLRARAAYQKFQARAPFWSLYNVCADSLAPFKVVWRRMDSRLRAAALLPDPNGRPILPQETLSLVAVKNADEADYLAARLNSDEIRALAESLALPGTKGFGSPGLLPLLGIERYRADNSRHRQIAEDGRARRLAAEAVL